MTTKLTIDELERSPERDLGASSWHPIEQHHIELFAEATGDHQWIHVDPELAAQGPFGTTIAHGYLSLSMLPQRGGSAGAALIQQKGCPGCHTIPGIPGATGTTVDGRSAQPLARR